MSPATSNKARFDYLDMGPAAPDVQAEILAGLQAPQKRINSKFFYDDIGSALFEQITELPEYYPTRTERGILQQHASEIAAVIGEQRVIIEPGAGSCEKIRLLLNSLRPRAYAPLDIAGDFLEQAARTLQQEVPWLHVAALRADFSNLLTLPEQLPDAPRVLFYPGSTLGNFLPLEASAFLRHARQLIGADGRILLGIDLDKDSAILEAAYNDSAGITARFNLNALAHINQLLNADFAVEQFQHLAFYNRAHTRIEMYLQSRTAQQVTIAGQRLSLAAGERIHTEYSCKYSIDTFTSLCRAANLEVEHYWTDPQHWFAVFCLRPD